MKILNVFTNEDGLHGNPVGIVVDDKRKIDDVERQAIAKESGYSEVVFINDFETNNISIYTPQNEIPFAGHAAIGAAYFLRKEYKKSVTKMEGVGGIIETWSDGGLTWVKCDASMLPPWNLTKLVSANEVVGIVRARTFASDWDIPEDEANGSGAMKLAMSLGRELTVYHGNGSIIHARPSREANKAVVGGLVVIIQ